MDIKEYVKQFNKPFNEVKTIYADEFKSMWDYENKWYQPLEKKTDLIKDANDRLSIENVIAKIRDSNYIFSKDDTESLTVFTSNINTLVRLANWINNFQEGVPLDNGTTLSLYDLFNTIKAAPSLGMLEYPLNGNLDNFLPHLFSVLKYCQNPREYPLHYKFGKNIIREVLGKDGDYDSVCKFFRTFPESDRLLNFYVYLGTIGMKIATSTNQFGLIIYKDSKDYKYIIKHVINVDRYIEVLDQHLAVKVDELDESSRQELISVIKKINDESAVRKFFKSVQKVLIELQLTNKDQRVYASALNNNLQFTIGGKCVVNVERKNYQVLLGFYVKDEFIGVLKSRYSNLIFSEELSEKNTEMSWVKIDPQNANVDDFYQGILALANESKKVQTKSQYRSQFSEKHNPWIIEAALNESVLNSLFTTDTFQLKPDKMKFPLNTILYGPPGTGKTYNSINKALEIIGENIEGKTRKEIKEIFDLKMNDGQIVFTTFHQSMSYEDFIEGIKPIEPEKDGDPVIYRVEYGVFRNLCVEASFTIAQLHENKTTAEVLDFSILYDNFVEEIEEKLLNGQLVELDTKAGGSVLVESISHQGNIIIKHHDGTRTYTVSKARLTKLQSAIPALDDLSNINNQFRAIIGGSNSSAYWSVLNSIRQSKPVISVKKETRTYTFDEKTEVVLALSKSDYKNKNGTPFVLIIDEINRGNVSQIFGELITLIEEDKRLGKDEALEVILPYSKDKFGVPANLYIIGTMNTADRSVEALDTALRRRFCFEEMSPKYDLKELSYDIAGTPAGTILKTINKRIEKLLDKDHSIGHSYFIKKENEKPEEKWLNAFYQNIIPLLEEYFFGDFGKIGLVLGQGFVKEKEWNKESDSFAGFDYESSAEFEDRSVYEIIDYRKITDGSAGFIKAIRLLMNEKVE